MVWILYYTRYMNSTIIVALITSVPAIISALIALATYISTKRGNKLEEELAPIRKELHEIRLDTTRTQLIMLMEHQPHNHDTVIKIAERYFLSLGGDWYLTSLFKEWAKREGIEIPANIYEVTKNHE